MPLLLFMAKIEQARPLSPASRTVRGDQDEALSAHFKLRRPSYFKFCGCYDIAAALFLILAIVAFAVFHARDPIVRMNRVQIPQLAHLVSNGTALVGANIIAITDVSVENPNVMSFSHSDPATEISYGGEVVGEGRIPAGRAAARRTWRVNGMVGVVPARIAAMPRLSDDLAAGHLTMERGFQPQRHRGFALLV